MPTADWQTYMIVGAVVVVLIALIIFKRKGHKGAERIDTGKEIVERLENILTWFSDKDSYIKFLNQGTKRIGRIRKFAVVSFDGEAMKDKSKNPIMERLLAIRLNTPANKVDKKLDKELGKTEKADAQLKAAFTEATKVQPPTIDPSKEPDRVKELYLIKVRKPRLFFPFSIFIGKTSLYLIPKSVITPKNNSLELSYNVSFDEMFDIFVCDETSKFYLRNTANMLTLESVVREIPNFVSKVIFIEEKTAALSAAIEKKTEQETRRYQAQTEQSAAS